MSICILADALDIDRAKLIELEVSRPRPRLAQNPLLNLSAPVHVG